MSYLKMTISRREPNSTPGYSGDSKVEWSVHPEPLAENRQRHTRDSLRVLREFWEESSSPGFRFKDFALTVLPEHVLNGLNIDKYTEETNQNATGQVVERTALSKKRSTGNLLIPRMFRFSSKCDSMELDIQLIDVMASYLTENPYVYQEFLSDLRDWDAFRLFLMRKQTNLSGPLNNRLIDDSTDGADVVATTDATVGAGERGTSQAQDDTLLQLEEAFNVERRALVEALSAASRRVTSLLEKNEELRKKNMVLETKALAFGNELSHHGHVKNSSSASSLKKKLRFHNSVYDQEKVKAATMMVHSSRELSVGEAAWAMELHNPEDTNPAAIEQIASILGTHDTPNPQSPAISDTIRSDSPVSLIDGSSECSPEELSGSWSSEDRRSPDRTAVNSDGVYPPTLVFDHSIVESPVTEKAPMFVGIDKPINIEDPRSDSESEAEPQRVVPDVKTPHRSSWLSHLLPAKTKSAT